MARIQIRGETTGSCLVQLTDTPKDTLKDSNSQPFAWSPVESLYTVFANHLFTNQNRSGVVLVRHPISGLEVLTLWYKGARIGY